MSDNKLNIGNVYVGSVTKEKFTILSIKKRYFYSTEEEVKLLCSISGKEIIATVPHILYLIKSGGLILQ